MSQAARGAYEINLSMEDDWEEVLDESSGQVYYFNNTSGESSWEKPEGFGGVAEPAAAEIVPAREVVADAAQEKEEGQAVATVSDWEEVLDESSGQVYYYNNANGDSSWEVPEGFGQAASGGEGTAGAEDNKEETMESVAAGKFRGVIEVISLYRTITVSVEWRMLLLSHLTVPLASHVTIILTHPSICRANPSFSR